MTPNCANPIIPSDNVEDLGVTIDYRLTYKDHINDVCNKVKKKTRWLLRTFHNRDAEFMKLQNGFLDLIIKHAPDLLRRHIEFKRKVLLICRKNS